MHWSSLAESGIAEDTVTGFRCWIDNFLRSHQRVFLVERSGLHEKFRRTRSIAHGGIASIQRDAQLDVFPQFARQRSCFHFAVCMNVGRSTERSRARAARFRPAAAG